ncbi:hypothetical protein JP28_03865 [Gallibacterium anatis]|uniref:single-stranded DNA-binding protein n=1 Tax=Gallibacterium anatis TaxID=750 RepID=UPI000531867F|nr:single-stranded DNA-binding protein [Gallibacterium anatis]KGQ44614.1 hypothetical protein JP28_03865 [Gallibacterium anatis]KGQ48088.1 hypothetical protein IO46_12240 [Gallibacterium anatis]KGQ53655.1 hypothetical protein IO44_10890 [Gallibacterium anatis str. Avicor]
MFSFNQVILLGNVGKDPTYQVLENKTLVATLSLATSYRYKVKDNEYKEQVDWHIIKAFGATAELISKHVKKGQKIQVVGQLKNNNYEDDAGVKHYGYFIRADRIIFAEKIERSQSDITTQTEEAETQDIDMPF